MIKAFMKICINILLLEHLISINFLIGKFKSKIPITSFNNYTNFPKSNSSDDELVEIQNYIYFAFNGTSLDEGKAFYPTKNPLISVIISVYNGEPYIKTALMSIQNQDFKNIEIIMVDDCSKDNSVNLIKKLMKNEPRLFLYQNDRNRGALYTKTKGVLLAKGKYILILDEDDIYAQKNAFSILYQEAEKYNLDLLSFISLLSKPKLKNLHFKKKEAEHPIIFQPKLREKCFKRISNGKVKYNWGMLHNYFIKRNIFIKCIKQIEDKYFNIKMNSHDDLLLFYLLTRNAYNSKQIDKIFHIYLRGWNTTNTKVKFSKKEKSKIYKSMRCNSLLNFIEFILYKTENTFYDKEIAFYSIDKWLLNNWCRNFTETTEKALKISREYLNNKFIKKVYKEKIMLFMEEKQK